MYSTIIFAALLAGLLLAAVVLWALCLRLGLRWAKVPTVTLRRVVFATVLVFLLQATLNVLFLFVLASSESDSIVPGLVELAMSVMIPWAVISWVFKARFLRAAQAWLPTLLASAITLALALLLVRPLLYEAFTVPTNAMAPTLLGRHWQGTCPTCGKANYCSPQDPQYSRGDPPLMICKDFHVRESSEVDRSVHSGDRFLVAKFLSARRWDLVVFQYPEEPSVLYVKRLVGLPGERIHIQDGSVWVDGKKQTPPESLAGLEYLSEMPDWYPDLWGSADRPALLSNDEYFVLGDFSAQSNDSRLWQQGALGHNPFAVPESHIKGIVTHTFWPPHRCRIHR